MMKSKRIAIAIGLILTIVIATWLLLLASQAPESGAKKLLSTQPTIDPSLKPLLREIEEIKRLSKSDHQKAEDRTDALIEKLPEKLKRYVWMGFKAGMLPINFYGQILDQYGEPVANPTITFETGGALLASGKGIGRVVGDEQGRFEIHSEGGSLELGGVQAPGIQFSYPTPKHLTNTMLGARHPTMRFVGGQKTKGGKEPLWGDTSPEHPYVFTAWRVEKYEKVLIGDLNSYQLPDGRIYTFKLDKNNYQERREEGITDGHLRVSCTRGAVKSYLDHRGDWQVTITPVDGGIQATDDLYLNLAPESGYQPSLTIVGSPEYKYGLGNQRYFFTAKNGQVYGSLYLHIHPYAKQGEKCRIDIAQYKINLNTSRNLAVKPRH
jgi:hypothetical protein